MMSMIFTNNYLKFLIPAARHLTSTRSNLNLGDEMKTLNDNKQYRKTLELFDIFNENNINKCSNWAIIQALKACTETNNAQRGVKIHHLISSRLKHDFYVLPSLIQFYMQCGDVNRAQLLFDTSTTKTLIMYGTMMKGYIKNNLPNKAIHLFKEIKDLDEVIVTLLFNACAQLATNEELDLLKTVSSKIPNSFYMDSYLLCSLIDAFMKCGDVTSAKLSFDRSTKKTLPMYRAMITGFCVNDQEEEAIVMFNEMHLHEFHRERRSKKKLKLLSETKSDSSETNIPIYLCLLKALAKLGISKKAESFVQQIPSSILTDHRIQTALMHMWGKVASVNEAKRIFEKISQPDHIAWTVMINSYGLNGMGIEAVKLFHQMPIEFIHDVTYICVLNACSHSGLVDVARTIFNNIQTKTEIIYTTMIDCLSRAALFEQAQQLIEQFERDHAPALPTYMALLSGARNEKNTKLSQEVVDRIQKLFPDVKGSLLPAWILLANTYASSGDIEKAADIKIELHRSGAKKKAGVTLTEFDGKIWRFRAHDQSHPDSAEIHAQVDRMSKKLIEYGYKYDASWIVRPIEADETVESLLCGHSERLAMALHFIRNRKPKRIQLTKNLRICGDCHQFTKLIALVYQCEIIVRDANRIHHFHINGQCLCQDYF
ncbi:unnamed protein product [Rotaria socialis]|uniref:DYW domain-containing protein n=6 Tax=Rotaria TaxID=231623 RepID=A0A817YG40_9BILA|nr:unnamed protein product [Rotaria socialis]CAF3377876.1 unnamed protein product [Rotaria socialis]CAF3586822.1 unnamed protein product [Rotaria socialis]CAF4282275.1 unnamed protein product [Rotaria socialis]CAF4740219.1 unnamed protein product [Rotaria socialis]